ncbi:MAG: hypothetical protein L3J35_03570 [Bacteroidales bacterium]|nr:hypothetical protein [Bacteroidales bacterium]
MKKVLLISVHGKYCEMYKKGEKDIEVRKNRPKQPFNNTVYVYNTQTQQIEIKAELDCVLNIETKALRNATLNGTGLSSKELISYSAQKNALFYLLFNKVYKIKRPIKLNVMRKLNITPPQSYMYIDENILLQALTPKQQILQF